ncbi:MAG: GIY-YIG nuclease family protein [Bacteroidia bacterium]
MFYVYFIYSARLDRYYVGYTSDLQKRLNDHNCGISAFTSKSKDWVLVYQEAFESREEAAERERIIKKKKSRKYLEWLIAGNNS